MQYRMGLIGSKVGMTQVFTEEGERVPVTVLEVGPCTVVQKRVPDKEGYGAIQIGFGERTEKHTTKAMQGHFTKHDVKFMRHLREVRLAPEDMDQFEEGQSLTVDKIFSEGDFVDVVGISKGKGFAGVMKKFSHKGSQRTHGTHEFFRHGGSIGCRKSPGRVFKGTKMPGQYGNKRVTVQNLRVAQLIPEKNLLLIRGAIQGAKKGIVFVQQAVKQPVKELRLGAN